MILHPSIPPTIVFRIKYKIWPQQTRAATDRKKPLSDYVIVSHVESVSDPNKHPSPMMEIRLFDSKFFYTTNFYDIHLRVWEGGTIDVSESCQDLAFFRK